MFNTIINRFRPTKVIVVDDPENKIVGDNVNPDDDEENAHQWDRPIEFLLSLISNSVGLGNVWRFPYLAAQNGGGAFLIPYFIIYFLIGAPLYFLELALGQFTSRGPGTGFVLARGWQGVGIAMIINSVLGTIYYNVLIAWSLFYFFLSFRTKLLWSKCGQFWNTDRCFEPGDQSSFFSDNGTTYNCTAEQYVNASDYACQAINTTGRVAATEEFFYRLLLNKSSSFDDFGTPGLYMTLLLLIAWIIICLCIIRGVQSSGKVAYFTAIFPYIVLLILIIFTATLKGADDGILYYIKPRVELLGDFKIWQAAAAQVFFSLSVCFGSLIAYSAANKFENNFYKQMCIVVSCDCFTGVFAGFAVFATIGFLARSLGVDVDVYAKSSGPGLAFITYPEALSKMPASPIFAIIFFAMLLALGLGTQFASTDVTITALMEFFPRYAKKRWLLVIITCIVFFLVSLPFACPGGYFLFELFQEYTANISLVFIGFFEVVAVAYIYGFDRFMNDIKMMLGKRAAEYYLFFTWCVAGPLLTLILTITNLLNSAPLKTEAGGGFEAYEFPTWSTVLGWLIFVVCVIPIPLVFIISYIQQYRRLAAERLINGNPDNADGSSPTPLYLAAFRENNLPADTWGPRKRIHHYGAYAHLNNRKPKNDLSIQQNFSKRSSPIDNGTNTINRAFDSSSIVDDDNNNNSSNF
ncbi:unnamed protein product [Adineta steineri]|uniref:Transporter n=1 Tax=Adineta steineri TaxID=433720 RepID=A0A814YK82_9BILA|nr:unnamed protein product [Adineta steineri]CAF3520751.1 unnamed protein product [Adineta steineri]